MVSIGGSNPLDLGSIPKRRCHLKIRSDYMSRSRDYNRKMAYTKAIRKRKIARETYYALDNEWEYYDNLHQYSKNKIHCSCPNCSSKTRNKGRRGKSNYNRSINYKRPDLIQQISMDNQMEEYDGSKIHRRVKYW